MTKAKIGQLRTLTGCSMQDAKIALDWAGGDVTLARGVIKYRGCAINTRGRSHKDWVMERAREFQKEEWDHANGRGVNV